MPTASPDWPALAAAFFEHQTIQHVAPVGNGNINDTYRLDIGGASWILQRLNHLVFTDPEGVMRNIAAVAAHLQRKPDFPLRVPAPLAGPGGRVLHQDAAGNYWRVFPFFDNTFAPEQLPDPSVALAAAGAYGVFLEALRDFPADQLVETIPGFHDTERRWAVFLSVLEKDPAGRVSSTQTEIGALVAAKPVFEAVRQLKQSGRLPVRVTHNDTKAGNVLLDVHRGTAVAVIDWDTIMPGTVLSDFGDMVRTFAPDFSEDHPGALTLRLDSVEALFRGFLTQTAGFLTAAERESLVLGALWIVGEQALRFLSDYLAGDVYYKIKYPAHNLVRAQNQLALFQALNQQRVALERLAAGAAT
ncbi:MAG: aminoglycoside phosphotransferase family protein [Saprospiraceae bacterium]|nr:aminoglycoside phosphotransferase family protein [Saprospiraceae bacterium]